MDSALVVVPNVICYLECRYTPALYSKHVMLALHAVSHGTFASMTIAIIIILAAIGGHCWGARAAEPALESIAQNAKKANAAHPQGTIRFSGKVSKGKSFEKQLGADLFFRLMPQELGWTISVGSKANLENNFCGVVTPPYRGINPIQIEGWHFRNSDNSGPNEVGSKNLNAPQKVREFYFVLNDTDYRKAFDALQIMLWPYSYSKQQIDSADDVHTKLPKGNGRLTIRELKLHTLEVGKQAGIEHMTIDVELKFPR